MAGMRAAAAAAAAAAAQSNALLTVTRGLSASICLPVALARMRAAMLRTAALPNVSPTTPTRSPLAGLRSNDAGAGAQQQHRLDHCY
jgi:hypothetical protein